MYIIQETNMRHLESAKQNEINKNNNSIDEHHNSIDTQWDNVWINNTNKPWVEHNNGTKVIRTRSGKQATAPKSWI